MIRLSSLVPLTEDFSTQEKKFIAAGFSKEVVKHYLEAFKKIRDAKYKVARDADIPGLEVSKGNERFDIDRYKSFEQVELLVDYVSGQIRGISRKGTHFKDIEVDGKPIGQRNGIEIYYAKNKQACVKYKGDKPYSWCVARSDASNMYNTYRYRQHEPTFYFVKDVEATEEEFKQPFDGEFKNKWHFFVVQRLPGEDEYIVTSANNDGDERMSWSDILEICPKLKGMEEYFKHVPVSPEERRLYAKFKEGVSDEDFVKLSYEEKEMFLDVALPGEEMTDAKFMALPDDLKNKFIGFGLGVTEEQFNYIKKNRELYKRFYQITVRKYETLRKDEYADQLGLAEWTVLLYSPDASKILEDGRDDDFRAMFNMDMDFNQILKVFGANRLRKYFQSKTHIKTAFLHTTGQNQETVLEFIDAAAADLTLNDLMSNNGPTSDEDILRAVQFLIKVRGKITVQEAVTTVGKTKDHLDYVIELYRNGKIVEEADSTEFGHRTKYSSLAAEMLGYMEEFDKVAKVFPKSVYANMYSGDLLPLIYKYVIAGQSNKFVNLIGLENLRARLSDYDTVNILKKFASNAEKFTTVLGYLGEEKISNIVRTKDTYGISDLMWNARKPTLPIIARIFGEEGIEQTESRTAEHIVSRLTGRDTEIDYDLPFLAKTLGKKFMRKIEGYTFLKLAEEARPEKRQLFLDTMWWAVHDNLDMSEDYVNDVVVFLAMSEKPAEMAHKLANHLDKIGQTGMYGIFRHRLSMKGSVPEETAKLIDALGTRINKMGSGTAAELFDNVYPLPILLALARNLIEPTKWLVTKMLVHAHGAAKSEGVQQVVDMLGSKIKVLDDYLLGRLVDSWMYGTDMLRILGPIFGEERLLNLIKSPETRAKAAEKLKAVAEHTVYRNYFLL